MKLSKDEFKVMLMLYAANIDGNIHFDEIYVAIEKSHPEILKSIKKVFDKMSDMEILECIYENKAQHAATETDRTILFDDLCAIIEADEKVTALEVHLLRTMRRILK